MIPVADLGFKKYRFRLWVIGRVGEESRSSRNFLGEWMEYVPS